MFRRRKIKKEKFNKDWKLSYAWINTVPKEPNKAYCKICHKIFSIAKGEIAVTDHEKKHSELKELTPENKKSVKKQTNQNGSSDSASSIDSVEKSESRGKSASEEELNARKPIYKEVYGSDTSNEGKFALPVFKLGR